MNYRAWQLKNADTAGESALLAAGYGPLLARVLACRGIALSTFTSFILHQNLLQSHGSGRPGSAWLPAYRFRWKHPC